MEIHADQTTLYVYVNWFSCDSLKISGGLDEHVGVVSAELSQLHG